MEKYEYVIRTFESITVEVEARSRKQAESIIEKRIDNLFESKNTKITSVNYTRNFYFTGDRREIKDAISNKNTTDKSTIIG